MPSHKITLIGCGPASLIAAEQLAQAGCKVTIYDRMASPARKFLMAGRGGLNLTHSEPEAKLLPRYGAAQELMKSCLQDFNQQQLIEWCHGLGQETFVGSSGRVFPKTFKASPLLRAWLKRLDELGVNFHFNHEWQGWDVSGHLLFAKPDKTQLTVAADAVLLALGGASWPKLGSNAAWVEPLRQHGIKVHDFKPANAGLIINWTEHFKSRQAGQPLKNIALTYAGRSIAGELMISQSGLEGTPAYTHSAAIRDELASGKQSALIQLDLHPHLTIQQLAEKLSQPRKRNSLSTHLQKTLHLSPPAIALIHEAFIQSGRKDDTPAALAALIKALPLTVTSTSGLERAISSAGGIDLNELDHHLMLKAKPGVFAAGEMLDWEAPTGGYLLQGCFSSGVKAARGILSWLATQA